MVLYTILEVSDRISGMIIVAKIQMRCFGIGCFNIRLIYSIVPTVWCASVQTRKQCSRRLSGYSR